MPDDFFFPRYRRKFDYSGGINGQVRSSIFSAWEPYTAPNVTEWESFDQKHSFNPRSSDTLGDVGGPFTLNKWNVTYGSTYALNTDVCVGTVGVADPPGWTREYSAFMASETDLNAWGTTAVARSLPTNPASGLATFLGELRSDGLPKLPGQEAKQKTLTARSAGSEYLNVEFGWLPFVSDIRQFADAVRNSKQIVDNYIKASDTKIRRRYGAPGVTSAFISDPLFGYAVPLQRNISTVTTVTETLETRRSFSGAFRYHIPMGDSQYEKLARYEALSNRLFGTRLTPSVLWEVAPWSWAVDWFTNTGDVIHNISALGFDGLVMQYGYATDVAHRTADLRSVVQPGNEIPANTVLTRHDERKVIRRVAANPFGFGITDTSLSARQTAILVALGLSRGRRQNPGGG